MNQLYTPEATDQKINPDLLAIRMASVNPILDPWVYILLRKTVVLKVVEKIKCLFCKMGARRQGGGRFLCMDGHMTSSIVSQDSPSFTSHTLMRVRGISKSTRCPSEGSLDGSFSHAVQTAGIHTGHSGSPSMTTERFLLEGRRETAGGGPAEGTEESGCVLEPSELRGLRAGNDMSSTGGFVMGAKDNALNVTFTNEVQGALEKCI